MVSHGFIASLSHGFNTQASMDIARITPPVTGPDNNAGILGYPDLHLAAYWQVCYSCILYLLMALQQQLSS